MYACIKDSSTVLNHCDEFVTDIDETYKKMQRNRVSGLLNEPMDFRLYTSYSTTF